MKIQIISCALALAGAAYGGAAWALPHVTVLPTPAVPASLSAADVAEQGKAIVLSLPDGHTYTVNGTRQYPAPGMVGLAARSPSGSPRLYAFVANDKLTRADAYGPFGHFELLETVAGTFWARARPEQGADELAPPAMPAPLLSGQAATAAPGPDGKYEIRVLILYTPLAGERLGGELEPLAQRVIFLASAIMDTSRVPVRYTLAGIAQFNGTSEDDNYYSNLDAMVASPDVRRLRDRTEADLVVLFRSQDGNPTGNGPGILCGLSNYFNNFERSDPPQSIDPNRDGFNVAGMAPSATGAFCQDYVVAHEMGHSLAGGHDYVTSAGFAYWKPYAHGGPCPGAGDTITYFSLMWGQGAGPGINVGGLPGTVPGGRGDIFTNPDLLLDGRVCGSHGAPGVEATQANNAKVMTEAAPYVAAYRGESRSRTHNVGGSVSLAGMLFLLMVGLARHRPVRSGAE